jgi:protease-4
LLVVLGGAYALFINSMVDQWAGGITEIVHTKGDETRRIVVLPISGPIYSSTTAWVDMALDHLEENPPQVLVLRINSPGGALGASDRIAHRIEQFRKKTNLKIVASYGDLAASGAYYITAGADHIVAEPTTITGSIGVIAQGFTFGELLAKIGVKPETIIAEGSNRKDVLDVTRDWTEDDKAVLRKFLDSGHTRFIQTVFDGRKRKYKNLTLEQVAEAATGEPFTTQEAMNRFKWKLVDSEGYLEDAIDQAKALAGIAKTDKVQVTRLLPPRTVMQQIGLADYKGPDIKNFSADQVRQWMVEIATPRIETRWAPGAR